MPYRRSPAVEHGNGDPDDAIVVRARGCQLTGTEPPTGVGINAERTPSAAIDRLRIGTPPLNRHSGGVSVAELAIAPQVGSKVEQFYMCSDLFEKRRHLGDVLYVDSTFP
jgi:hypothetical protein